MVAICQNFKKKLSFRISDPIQNLDHLQTNFLTIQNPDSSGFQIPNLFQGKLSWCQGNLVEYLRYTAVQYQCKMLLLFCAFLLLLLLTGEWIINNNNPIENLKFFQI